MRYCHLAGTVIESSKGHFLVLSNQLLLDRRDDGIPGNSMSRNPLPYFFGCEVSSLIRNNAVWNTIMVDKQKHSMQESRFISQLSISSSKNETLILPQLVMVEVKFLSPRITSIPATIATLFKNALDNDRVAE